MRLSGGQSLADGSTAATPLFSSLGEENVNESRHLDYPASIGSKDPMLFLPVSFCERVCYNPCIWIKSGTGGEMVFCMIYVMSDIHGNLRRFESVLAQIGLQPEDTLYILGDVIDRHPDGIRILRRIMATPNMHMLLGNHEYMMLRALGEPYDEADREAGLDPEACLALWYRNGGGVTHRYLKRISKAVRRELFAYLKALPLNIDITVDGKAYKLVHGGPEEAFADNRDIRYPNATHFSVWKRWQPEDALPGGYTMIFGHTPTRYFQEAKPMTIYHGKARIGIDCGSGYPETPDSELHGYGRLACLRLDDGREFYSEE